MLQAEIDAIVGGYHADAFHILGPHNTDTGWTVRAFLPQTQSAAVQTNNQKVEMKRVHDAGFFIANLNGKVERYQLVLQNEQTIDDPYRFGPIISDFDLHLHTEGTLNRAWETFGAHPQIIDNVAGVRF